MSASISALTLSCFDQLPKHARECVFWQVDAAGVDTVGGLADPEFEKEAWLSMVMLEWGSCGQLARNNEKTLGYALYAPPGDVPRSMMFPTSPVSPDAVLLTTLVLAEDSEGLGRQLVSAVVSDLVRRGVRALEAFGIVSDLPAEDYVIQVPEINVIGDCTPQRCMISAEFLQEVGFAVIKPHPKFPRLRLELDRDLGWQAGVEEALERLIETVTISMDDALHSSKIRVDANAN
ncbi:MAG: GNAT family N-acetyltransferase [Mycobacteriaceae bacterium]